MFIICNLTKLGDYITSYMLGPMTFETHNITIAFSLKRKFDLA